MSLSRQVIFVAALLISLACVGARPVAQLSEQEKLDKCDLYVLALPVKTRDTNERIKLQGISPDIEVIGVETIFIVVSIRKGDETIKRFVLHHYRFADPRHENGGNTAQLVKFDPGKGYHFKLYLLREADGRYAPLDQTDPESNSIEFAW